MHYLFQKPNLSGSAITIVAATLFTLSPAMAQSRAPEESVEEIVVTGTSIRGAALVGSSVITVDQKAIEATAPVNAMELLQSVTAINTAGAAPQGENVGTFHSPQIHSLGASAANSTLNIIDGLRQPGGGTQGFVQNDPGIIPTLAIERVEVLAEGASSIYGSDAVAGVVNFITRKSYEGVLVQAQTGFADSYNNKNIGLLMGSRWDRGSVMAAASYAYQSSLARADRELLSRGDYRPLGGTLLGVLFGCPTAAIAVPGSTNLYLTPTSTTTVAPVERLNGNCNTNIYGDVLPESRRANALIKLNQDVSDDLSVSWMLNANILKLDAANPPGSLSNVTVYGAGATGAPLTNGQINPFFRAPAGAPGATQESISWVALLGNGPNGTDYGRITNEEDVIYSTFVATYDVSNAWQIKFSDALAFNRSVTATIDTFCTACALLALNGTALTNGNTTTSNIAGQNTRTLNLPLTTANSLDVWNPPGSTNRTSADVLRNLYRGQTDLQNVNTMNQSKLEVSGDLFDIPAGTLKAAVGGEFVTYHLVNKIGAPNGTGPVFFGQSNLPLRFDRDVWSAYGEIQVPIVSPEMDISFVRKVALSVSGRYDDYSDVGSTTNPKFALDWEISQGLRLRGNYATAFVAPPLGILGDPSLGGMYRGGGTVTNGGIAVPVDAYPQVRQLPGCATATVSCTLASSVQGLARAFGGIVTGIKPQTGTSWSVGADLAPEFLPEFKANVTLFNNKFNGGVSGTTNITQITSVPSLNSLLQIYPTGATPEQIAAFTRIDQGAIFSGTIPTIVYFTQDNSARNIVFLRVQGIDLTLNYAVETDMGTFKFGHNVTHFTKFRQGGGPGTPYYSILGTSGFNSAFPSIQTQMRTNLGWEDEALAVDFFVNYTSDYRYVGATTANPILFQGPGGTFSGGGDKVKSNLTVDTHIAYNFAVGALEGQQIYIDVKNLFDKDPPFMNGAHVGAARGAPANGYNAFVSNPIGRIISAGVRARF